MLEVIANLIYFDFPNNHTHTHSFTLYRTFSDCCNLSLKTIHENTVVSSIHAIVARVDIFIDTVVVFHSLDKIHQSFLEECCESKFYSKTKQKNKSPKAFINLIEFLSISPSLLTSSHEFFTPPWTDPS